LGLVVIQLYMRESRQVQIGPYDCIATVSKKD